MSKINQDIAAGDAKTNLLQIVKFIVTFGYSGFLKPASGTMGTIAAFFAYYLFGINTLSILAQLIIELFVFSLGFFATRIYIAGKSDQDPSEIVIDEAAAIMFCLTLVSALVPCLNVTDYSNIIYFANDYTKVSAIFHDYFFGLFNSNRMWYSNALIHMTLFEVLLAFVFFRVFDIFKITPASYFDKKVKNAFGVMMDDIVAAIYSAGIVISLVFFSIKFYKFIP